MAYSIAPILDESQWEWFMLRTNPNALFQSWAWGEVGKRMGSVVDRFGIWEGSTLMGIFQTVEVRAKRGSFLHVRHGPVLANDSAKLWKAVVSFLTSEAKKRNVWFVRMNPVVADSPHMQKLVTLVGGRPAAIHRMDGEQCWVLDLTVPEETLLAGMRKSSRYEIRRADKVGVTIYSTSDPVHIEDFMTLYGHTSSRHGFVPHLGIREEFEIFAKRKQAMLYLGKHDNTIISGAIILYYGHQAIYHHGASVPSQYPVSHAVQWEAIKEAKKRGMNVYNFWGIAPDDSPKHPWRGITVFKKGFGGSEVNYIHAIDIPVSPMYVMPRMIETLRKAMRGYD